MPLECQCDECYGNGLVEVFTGELENRWVTCPVCDGKTTVPLDDYLKNVEAALPEYLKKFEGLTGGMLRVASRKEYDATKKQAKRAAIVKAAHLIRMKDYADGFSPESLWKRD